MQTWKLKPKKLFLTRMQLPNGHVTYDNHTMLGNLPMVSINQEAFAQNFRNEMFKGN